MEYIGVKIVEFFGVLSSIVNEKGWRGKKGVQWKSGVQLSTMEYSRVK